MDFRLSDDQRELVELLEKVGREKLRPGAFEARFSPDEKPTEKLKVLAELGILGMCFPADCGGGEQPFVNGILAIEKITENCPMTGHYALMAIGGPPMFLAKWGSENQKKTYLPAVLRGEETWSISLTEPVAGSDLTALKTHARIDGDRCIVNGHKIFCSFANVNDRFLVFVRFSEGAKGIGAVIVSRDTPGFKIGPTKRHMSGAPWCELFFDDAEISVEDVLLEGNAFRKLMSTYSLERCAGAVTNLADAHVALNFAIEQAKDRTQFGRRIADFQMTQARLANMYMRYEGARLLLYKAAVEGDESPSARLNTSIAMVAATEAAAYVCEQAMNIFGGSGMSQDFPLEWLYRRSREYWAAGGTNDIHRSMIAADILGLHFDHRPMPASTGQS